jgi:hypothetical protein
MHELWDNTWENPSYQWGMSSVYFCMCVDSFVWAAQGVQCYQVPQQGEQNPTLQTSLTLSIRHPHHAFHLGCHNLLTSKHGMNPSDLTLFHSMPFSYLTHGLRGGVATYSLAVWKSSQFDKPIFKYLLTLINITVEDHLYGTANLVCVLMRVHWTFHDGSIHYVYLPGTPVFS